MSLLPDAAPISSWNTPFKILKTKQKTKPIKATNKTRTHKQQQNKNIFFKKIEKKIQNRNRDQHSSGTECLFYIGTWGVDLIKTTSSNHPQSLAPFEFSFFKGKEQCVRAATAWKAPQARALPLTVLLCYSSSGTKCMLFGK